MLSSYIDNVNGFENSKQVVLWLKELKLRRDAEEENRSFIAKLLHERYDDFLYVDLTLMYEQLSSLNDFVIGQGVFHYDDERHFSLCWACKKMSNYYFNSGYLECSVCCPLDIKTCAYITSPIVILKEKLNNELDVIEDIEKIKKIKLKFGWKLTTLNGRKVAVFLGDKFNVK